jgi:hypothetical protein
MEAIPKIFKEMPRRERFSIAPLGEYYMDLLTIDSTINARSKAIQANSLLCAKLQEREQKIRARVEYLASKRGIGADELWIQILKGEFEDIKPEEIKDMEEMEDDELEQ